MQYEEIFEEIDIHPDRVADFELALNDLWLDICNYVEDTMWQMFLKGKSWDGTDLTDFVLPDYHSEDFYKVSRERFYKDN